MPDIELFGDGIEEASVRQALHDASYIDALTFINHKAVVSVNYVPGAYTTPAFIRVAATHQFKFMADLIARLRRLKIDLEIVKIETFYPKGELK
jgi:hypothetical protein